MTLTTPETTDNENGQIMVLAIGYVALALLVATVMLGVTSLYLEHKRLLSLADGAAIAAADSFTLGEVAATSGRPAAVLNADRVRNTAQEFLTNSPASQRFDALAVAGATGTPDGATAVVVLTAAVHPPIINFLVPDGFTISVTSTARSQLTR